MSSSNSGGMLRPAWNRGNSKGFQPPPQVEQQQSSRTGSKGQRNDTLDDKLNITQPTSQRDNYNKFSALDIDDDDVVLATTTSGASSSLHNNATNDGMTKTTTTTKSNETKPTNSRSEGLRSGRSLADLAARAPQVERSSIASRFSSLRTVGGASAEGAPTDNKIPTVPPSAAATEENVIRYTRERILSLRPAPLPESNALLKKELDGSPILSDKPQDPVCWDNLDTEKIWSTVPSRRNVKDDAVANMPGIRRTTSITAPGAAPSIRRDTSNRDGGGGGRWQRGVALPPEGSALSTVGKQHRSGRDGVGNHHQKDAENPNDLWDDPASSGDGALMDFSAFGDTGNDTIDFDKMADASKKIEDELHGTRSRASSNATNDGDEIIPVKSVNPNRPLATAGTTIRSGSGDHVNVFEDFDDPGIVVEDVSGSTKITPDTAIATSESPHTSTIKAANEDPSASSRLMAMIGVKKDDSAVPDASLTAWGQQKTGPSTMPVVSLNPWGDPIVPPTASSGSIPIPVISNTTNSTEMQQHGLDLQARLRQAEFEKQKVEENHRLQEELQRQRQQHEEERARVLQQQQLQQQQQSGVQSQVEVVLMERISTILESSWGRSDLVSILSTLHAEDPRVIPLLNNIDALRALLLRNPRRVALREDPSLRIEMAALLVTNTQWHTQQQQQEAMQQQQALQLQQRQEELHRRERQRQLEEQQAATARSQQQAQQIIPDAPWFYSDPSENIQGPFRGEEMRQWLEAGYFKGDLPISQNPSGPFRPLAAIFADVSVAFVNPTSVATQAAIEQSKVDEQRRHEEAERTRIEAEATERELRRAEEQRKENEAVAEQRRQNAEAKASAKAEKAKAANGGNDSSNQLKLMLGLGSTLELQQHSKKTSDVKVTLQEVQLQQTHISKPHPEPVNSTKNSAPAWGGAAVTQPVTKKSMSEIQKEEARAAAVAAMNRQSVKPSSSGWANVAAAKGGSTAWSGGVAKPQIAAVILTTPTPTATVQRALPIRSVSTGVTAAPTASTSSVPQGQVQRASSVSSRETGTANAFGGKMEPALEKWCKDQMYKLNGTDDLTLVDFCMILTDSEEIRQYLTAYLGSTPQVNTFATEFIQRKGGDQKKNVEEWESTATGKKGKKKKAGN